MPSVQGTSVPVVLALASPASGSSVPVVLPFDGRVVSVTAVSSAAPTVAGITIDVTVGGTSVFAATADKPVIALTKTQAQTTTTNADYRAVATNSLTAKGATQAYQQENPTGDLTGKWTSQTPATVASTAGSAVAVAFSGGYTFSGTLTVVLEVEKV